jgi:hypothetical protein
MISGRSDEESGDGFESKMEMAFGEMDFAIGL